MAVQNGGKLINNGSLNIRAASLDLTEDLGPVGGQVRIFEGSLTNEGKITLDADAVNTHGAMFSAIEGSVVNNGDFKNNGFQVLVVSEFINGKTGTVYNNSHFTMLEDGEFVNNGKVVGEISE